MTSPAEINAGSVAEPGPPDSPRAPDACRVCGTGRLAAWSVLRVGSAIVSVGPAVLIGSVCDRCAHVELRARAESHPPVRAPAPASAGGDLLAGVLANLSAALREIRGLVRPRRG